MYELLAYFLFNFLGFLAFYLIWLKLDKPEPYDYTTICGLKCQELQLKKSSIVLPRGFPISKISRSKGNLEEIRNLGSVEYFLNWLHDTYGDLAAFHWGARYVVSIRSLSLVDTLKKYEKSLRMLCPLLYASILIGDSQAWKPSNKVNHDKKIAEKTADEQAELFLSFNPEIDYVSKPIEFSSKWIKGPLCIVFDCEIEIDAHPVPADIPILIHIQSENVLKQLKWIFNKDLF